MLWNFSFAKIFNPMIEIVLYTRQASVCVVLKNLMKGTFSSFSQCQHELFVTLLPLDIFRALLCSTKTWAAVYPCRLIFNMEVMAASDAPM